MGHFLRHHRNLGTQNIQTLLYSATQKILNVFPSRTRPFILIESCSGYEPIGVSTNPYLPLNCLFNQLSRIDTVSSQVLLESRSSSYSSTDPNRESSYLTRGQSIHSPEFAFIDEHLIFTAATAACIWRISVTAAEASTLEDLFHRREEMAAVSPILGWRA